jgi:spermidine synthase
VRQDGREYVVGVSSRQARRGGDGPLLVWLATSLLVTGACSLIYQQLWLRLLSLVFGVTVYAAATAIGAFMAGLALGGYLAGKLADRTARPLAWYGTSEIGAGTAALLTSAALAVTEDVYVDIVDVVGHGTGVTTLARLVLSFVVLTVPATIMGASTPLVLTAASARSGRIGERTGLLYAVNTAGAIIGTLLAGFVLIGEFGVAASFRGAAIVNIVVGAAMLAASWLVFERRPTGSPAVAAVDGHPRPGQGDASLDDGGGATGVDSGRRRLVLAVFVVSGFVSLALEIVWFRVLILYVESTTYAFSAMLAIVLLGIALGSAVVTPLMRMRVTWLQVLAWLEVAAGVAALCSLAFLARSYGVADALDRVVPVGRGSSREVVVIAAVTILPTALLFGAAFPIGVRLYAERTDHPGEAIGRFYALNLLGGIAGTIVAGFVLLPAIGSRGTVAVLAAMLLASGVLLLVSTGQRMPALGAALAFVLLVVVALPDPWQAAVRRRLPDHRLVFDAEGAQSTVWVTEVDDGGRALYLDGLVQASAEPFTLLVHEQIGLLPLALHPDPRDVLVVGLGGGVTPGAMGIFDEDLDITVVELSPEVVDAASRFEAWNHGVLDQDHVDVRIDDGRNFLLTTDERYDVITADIIQPRTPGAGKLWSAEYWELARDALAPGGIVLQWVGTDRTRVEYELIVRTFLTVFPHATVWESGTLLVGTTDPLRIDADAVAATLSDGTRAAALGRVGVTSVEDLLGRYTAGPKEIVRFVGDGPLLTDDLPRIEYWRSLDLPPASEPVAWQAIADGADVADVLE